MLSILFSNKNKYSCRICLRYSKFLSYKRKLNKLQINSRERYYWGIVCYSSKEKWHYSVSRLLILFRRNSLSISEKNEENDIAHFVFENGEWVLTWTVTDPSAHVFVIDQLALLISHHDQKLELVKIS